MSSNISLYIPHVFLNISNNDIAGTFEKLKIGKVLSVDLVHKMGKDTPYNAAYIHFEYWYDNTAARNFQERVLNPEKEARIIYDEPWYWIVFENKSKKHAAGDRKQRIALGLQEEDIIALTNQQMTNNDFSNLVNAPNEKYQQEMPEMPLTDLEKMEELLFMEMEEECEHLITIDGRYVEELERDVAFSKANVGYVYSLENENDSLKKEIESLRMGYYGYVHPLENENYSLKKELESLKMNYLHSLNSETIVLEKEINSLRAYIHNIIA